MQPVLSGVWRCCSHSVGALSLMRTMPLEIPLHSTLLARPQRWLSFYFAAGISFGPLFVLCQEGRRWLIIGIMVLTLSFIINKSTHHESLSDVDCRLLLSVGDGDVRPALHQHYRSSRIWQRHSITSRQMACVLILECGNTCNCLQKNRCTYQI